MAMRKYYIPTSTLNFNNIMSSESISPKAFYALRGFGYPYWKSIPENDVDNAIILYEKPFTFTRPASDLEDHPMLVEIQSEEDFPTIEDGIFYSDHTIYLSPWKTKFFFFEEQDENVTLSRSDHSVEVKLVDFYSKKKCMRIVRFPNASRGDIHLDVELNKETIEKDYRINKMKGLLYGYYIGGVFTYPINYVRQDNILRELQNISNIILSTDISSVRAYREKICDLLKEYQSWTIIGMNLVGRYGTSIKKPEDWKEYESDWEVVYKKVLELMQYWDVKQSKELFDASDFFNKIDFSKEDNLLTRWLKSEDERLRQEMHYIKYECGDDLAYVTERQIYVSDLQLLELRGMEQGAEELELIKTWVNHVLIQKKYSGNKSFKSELSDEITKAARDVYKESWEDCGYRRPLNEMRRYVRMQDNKLEWNDCLISSIAAVIAHGDDWNKLHDFMWKKTPWTHYLVSAFYGELNGFADLDRTLFDKLYNIDDEYFEDVYKEIYNQLLREKPDYPFNTDVNETAENNAIQYPVSLSCIKWKDWQDDLRDYIANEIVINSKKTKAILNDFDEAIKLYGSDNDIQQFMEFLHEFENWHTPKRKEPNVAWKKLKKYVGLNYTDKKE